MRKFTPTKILVTATLASFALVGCSSGLSPDNLPHSQADSATASTADTSSSSEPTAQTTMANESNESARPTQVETPAQTTSSAEAQKSTQVVYVNPWKSDGSLADGVQLEDTADNQPASTCNFYSSSGQGKNTYSCGPSAYSTPACRKSPTEPNRVACLRGVEPLTVMIYNLTGVPKDTEAPETSYPYMLQIEDGSFYRIRTGGAIPSYEGMPYPVYWGAGEGNPNSLYGWDATGDNPTAEGEVVHQNSEGYWQVKAQEYAEGPYNPKILNVAKVWYIAGDEYANS